jgi:hypothetical protein
MERFQEARAKAEKSLRIADHMLFITYPLVKDNKLLMSILENIYIAFSQSMSSVLYYERTFKRIPPFHDTFESKFNLFKVKLTPKYRIDELYIETIRKVQTLVKNHKNSPVEFIREGKFVICSEDYRMHTITVEELKSYITTAKSFIKQNNRIVEKNEYIFK